MSSPVLNRKLGDDLATLPAVRQFYRIVLIATTYLKFSDFFQARKSSRGFHEIIAKWMAALPMDGAGNTVEIYLKMAPSANGAFHYLPLIRNVEIEQLKSDSIFSREKAFRQIGRNRANLSNCSHFHYFLLHDFNEHGLRFLLHLGTTLMGSPPSLPFPYHTLNRDQLRNALRQHYLFTRETTLLHAAAIEGRLSATSLLLRFGFDPTSRWHPTGMKPAQLIETLYNVPQGAEKWDDEEYQGVSLLLLEHEERAVRLRQDLLRAPL